MIKPNWADLGLLQNTKFLRFPPISFGILAALTPPKYHITYIDNDFQQIPYSDTWDLVCLTAATCQAFRAYSIAQKFAKLGVPTVLGGIHATMVPHESLQYCDAVVVGEAEEIWLKLLQDLENERMRGIYHSDHPLDLKKVPIPNHDLFNYRYYYPAIQATRGCPFNCEFCTDRMIHKPYRKRPIQNVIQELKSIRGKYFYFLDSNLFADAKYAKTLFKYMIKEKLNKKWWCQSSIFLGKDEELLNLAVESGLFAVQMGLESFSQTTLNETHKIQNKVKEFRQIVQNLNDYQVLNCPFFVFGFDTDKPDVFEKTVHFAKAIGIDNAAFWILTPFPGTALYNRLKSENRILSENWNYYDVMHCVFQPKHLSPTKLEEGLFFAYEKFYEDSFNPRNVLKRILSKTTFKVLKTAFNPYFHLLKFVISINKSLDRIKASVLNPGTNIKSN
ncbi:MAG: B12-binding domain-containing radical SAM protein [Candidatus Helarchaeota archaeon]